MTPTLRTDAVWDCIKGSAFWENHPARLLSEELERELNEWKAALTSLHHTDRGTPAEMARDIHEGMRAAVIALRFAAAERDEIKAEIADVRDATKATMDESCDCNERHCTCVPLLRAEVKRLTSERDHSRKLLEDESRDALTLAQKLDGMTAERDNYKARLENEKGWSQ